MAHKAISTHAPRTGSDTRRVQRLPFRQRNFNPRSPHGERPRGAGGGDGDAKFQPTLPARGATGPIRPAGQHHLISTHAPRTGSDNPSALFGYEIEAFQPTLPARGATWTDSTSWATPSDFNPRSPHGERLRPRQILPHGADFNPRSPHGERQIKPGATRQKEDFNPRSPHGERLVQLKVVYRREKFQPTLPARGATSGILSSPTDERRISTHAPRTGSDSAK